MEQFQGNESLFAVILTFIVIMFSPIMACHEGNISDEAVLNTEQAALKKESAIDRIYKHPLKRIEPVNGKIPTIDTQESPDGD